MMSSIIKTNLSKVAERIPLKFLSAITQKKNLFAVYHYVNDEYSPHVSNIMKYRNINQFIEDLKFIVKYYKPITLDEFLKCINDGKPLLDNSFFLSFDDGYREMYDIVCPILYREGIPATFFLLTSVIDNKTLAYFNKQSLILESFKSYNPSQKKTIAKKLSDGIGSRGLDETILECVQQSHDSPLLDEIAALLEIDFNNYLATKQPYLTTDQVKAMIRQGFSIGAHSVTHPLYSELKFDEQIQQTIDSINEINRQFDYPCKTFAFPHEDKGITHTFFNKIFTDHGLEATFGTSCYRDDSNPRVFQRISMDSIVSAENALKVELLIYFLRKCLRRSKSRRN